jgi:hypothetical protein
MNVSGWLRKPRHLQIRQAIIGAGKKQEALNQLLSAPIYTSEELSLEQNIHDQIKYTQDFLRTPESEISRYIQGHIHGQVYKQ